MLFGHEKSHREGILAKKFVLSKEKGSRKEIWTFEMILRR